MIKHLDLDPNLEKLLKFGTTRPEQVSGKTQKIFRLSMTGFRPKKANEAEFNFTSSLYPSKTPKAKASQDQRKELNIAGTQLRGEGNRKVKLMQSQTQSNFFPKPSQPKFGKSPVSELHLNDNNNNQKQLFKQDVISLRAPVNAFQRTSTAAGQQRQFMKIPIADLYTASVQQNFHRTVDNDAYGIKTMTECTPAEKNNLFSSTSNENIDDVASTGKTKRAGTFSTLESSSQLTKLKNSSNFSLSTSQNTYIGVDFEKAKSGNDPNIQPDVKSPNGLKVREKMPLMRNATSKKVTKFNEDVEKAKMYNDQMIKQFQFEKENEEEEHDFAELCEILQSNIKE